MGFYWSLTPLSAGRRPSEVGAAVLVFLLPRTLHLLPPVTALPSGSLTSPCPHSLTPLCCVLHRGRLTTRGKFYWAFGSPAGTAQGSLPGWGRRWGSSTGLPVTRVRGPERRERRPEGEAGKCPGPPGRQAAVGAAGGCRSWYWAAGRGRKQRRSSKGNIQHRTGGAACRHLHERKRAVRRQPSGWERTFGKGCE